MQTIHHRLPGQTTLSRFAYTYDVVGNIVTWTQQAGTAAPHVWRYGYDRADQLTRAVEETTDPTPLVLARYGYGYDPAGNRTYEQIDDQVTSWTHDALNRLVTQAGGGVLRVAGTVNEPATVTVNGVPAPGATAEAFAAGVPVTAGTNVVTITATDPSGNAATAAYEVDVAEAEKTFTYDANGNLTSDGTRTFEWDARNQLVAVTIGTHRSEFVYDGLQRRVRQIEKENGVTTADTRVLWCETAICEERAADGVTVTRRAFGLGEQVNSAARYFATDHLGSVREVTDTAGTLLARYAFDPWGSRTVTAGADVTTVGFTGYRTHTSSGLALTLYRGYDAGLGRWVSEDPIGIRGGLNLSAYVSGQPIARIDLLGLKTATPCGWTWVGLLGKVGNMNNQVIFCAPCGPCEERVIKSVQYAGQAPPAGSTAEPPASLAEMPSTPQLPFSTIDRCGCKGSDKVYVNVQTRRAVHSLQYAWTASQVTLEYECRKK